MSPLDQFFKFSIGSFVRPSIAELSESNETEPFSLSGSDERFTIVERRLQECPGGIQKHYVARAGSANGSTAANAVIFNEIELIASDKFPRRETSEERIARRTREKAERSTTE